MAKKRNTSRSKPSQKRVTGKSRKHFPVRAARSPRSAPKRAPVRKKPSRQASSAYLTRYNKLRGRLYESHRRSFEGYADTARIAAEILRKNDGRAPKQDEKLARLLKSAKAQARRTAAKRKRKPVAPRTRTKKGKGRQKGAKARKKPVKKVGKKKKKQPERPKRKKLTYKQRISRVRKRLWKAARDQFASYKDTLPVATCVLEKNKGKIPRSNKKLLALIHECQVELEPPVTSPCDEPHPTDIDYMIYAGDQPVDYSFFQLDELMQTIPPHFPYWIASHLSRMPKFKRHEYDYSETFKPYVEFCNQEVSAGRLNEYHSVRMEWRCNEQDGHYLYVLELEPSGFATEEAEAEVLEPGVPAGPVATEDQVVRDEKERLRKEALAQEIKQLENLRKDLITEKDKLVDEFRLFLAANDKKNMKAVAESINIHRTTITNLTRRINDLIKQTTKWK